jgi:hypothetical protein
MPKTRIPLLGQLIIVFEDFLPQWDPSARLSFMTQTWLDAPADYLHSLW